MLKALAWLLAMVLGFGAGASVGRNAERDEELEKKVQAHVDVIVDESAGIVDDVAESARKRREEAESELKDSDCYKKAKEFVDDMDEIVENTKSDVEAHFGDDETETEMETEEETK